MPPFSIRPIRPDEWPRYRDIRLRALQDSPDAFGSTYEAEAGRPDTHWESRLRAAAASGQDLALCAQVGDQLCGLAWCKVDAADAGIADLFQMWVAPDHRRQGIGGALLAEALAWAARAGVRQMRLGVTIADTPAQRLYASRGFRPVGPPAPLREGSGLMAQGMTLELAGIHLATGSQPAPHPGSSSGTTFARR